MTALALERELRGGFTAHAIGFGAVATGTAILLARPAIESTVGWSVAIVAAVFAMVLALGLAAPAGTEQQGDVFGAARRLRLSPLVTLSAGASVFIAGRLLQGGHAPVHGTAILICLNTLAAVAEEAIFRRVAFGALLAAGPVTAVAGSALLFGVAHVTVYGWWAFPLDVAAGVVLGWQRWVSGSWLAPAATHAFADLLVVI